MSINDAPQTSAENIRVIHGGANDEEKAAVIAVLQGITTKSGHDHVTKTVQKTRAPR